MRAAVLALAMACVSVDLPDEGSEEDRPTTRPPREPDDAPATPALAQVCYPGPEEDWTACMDVHAAGDWGADYVYPEPYAENPEQYVAPVRFVDLQEVDAALAVAPNFVVSELMEAWKGRYGVFQPHVVHRLQDIRDTIQAPLTVSSAYRNPGYNEEVGGVLYSRHQYGDAVDIQSEGATLEELADLCWSFGASYVGSDYPAHVHCDWRDEPLDPAFFNITEE